MDTDLGADDLDSVDDDIQQRGTDATAHTEEGNHTSPAQKRRRFRLRQDHGNLYQEFRVLEEHYVSAEGKEYPLKLCVCRHCERALKDYEDGNVDTSSKAPACESIRRCARDCRSHLKRCRFYLRSCQAEGRLAVFYGQQKEPPRTPVAAPASLRRSIYTSIDTSGRRGSASAASNVREGNNTTRRLPNTDPRIIPAPNADETNSISQKLVEFMMDLSLSFNVLERPSFIALANALRPQAAERLPGVDEMREHFCIHWANQEQDATVFVAENEGTTLCPRRMVDLGATVALLRVLAPSVEFVQFLGLDLFGSIRCKAIPVRFLRDNPRRFADGVDIAKVCIGGLPSYGDVILPETGLTAVGSFHLTPSLSTLRVLPYHPSSAIVLGNFEDWASDNNNMRYEVNPFCARSLLQRVVAKAAAVANLQFGVGVELEFCLYDKDTNTPVEGSNFADARLLHQQQEFFRALHGQLVQQDIAVELVHAESAPGQAEVVLAYSTEPLKMVDSVVLARQTIIAVARTFGLKAIFLPKLDMTQAGNGCHMHISLNRDGRALGMISDERSFFQDGILSHLGALMGLTMPSLNSFRRVGEGNWTGSQASSGVDDKNSALRILPNRFEYKLCDSAANPYLALAGILTAGLDGISSKLCLADLGELFDPQLPVSLALSLDRLEADQVLGAMLGDASLTAYVAVRRAEANRQTSLEDEKNEALRRAS